LASDDIENLAPLWAFVWLLFFEMREGENEGDEARLEDEKDPKVVLAFAELVPMFVSLTGLEPHHVKERLMYYRTFDPQTRRPASRLGTAARKLRDFLEPLFEEVKSITAGNSALIPL
jgi:hypothetical protein